MPWSAENAMCALWTELGKNVSDVEKLTFFLKHHLQKAYDAGRQDEMNDDMAAFDLFVKR